MKYILPNDQGEALPNKLGLVDEAAIGLAEFEGFLKADIALNQRLSSRTKFTLKYIQQIHQLALGHLYQFAGKWRDVNMSKGGFTFPSALFLPQSMQQFEAEILNKLPKKYAHKEELIERIAVVHGELLFLHPFREGNGRTTRLLSNLMMRQQGHDDFLFQHITASSENFEEYVKAIQQCGQNNYQPIINIMKQCSPP